MGTEQTDEAHEPTAVVNESRLRSTLRDARAFFGRRHFWMLLGGGIAIAALSGPFHTMQMLSLPARVLYWSVAIGVPTLLLTVLSIYARHLNAAGRVHWSLAALGAALCAVPPVYVQSWAMNRLVDPDASGTDPLLLLVYVTVPVVLVNLMVNSVMMLRHREAAQHLPVPIHLPPGGPPPSANDPPEPGAEAAPRPVPLLFEKLPPELGHDLICLRAQDHYIEAMTTQGSATVLMRLSDAERDLAGLAGLRVHRSWWVNLDHVADFVRTEGGGMDLTLSNGLVIPVARGQRAALRSAIHKRRVAAE